MRRDGATVDRRTVLRTLGAVTAGTALAGCTGGNDSESSGGDGGGGDGDGSGGGDGGSPPAGVENWMSDVGNYDGVVDRTGESELTVTVGAESNGGGFAFAPAAVRVETGTTVTWEWTGEGGQHNVVADDGSFESELVNEAGHTFEHTLEDAGTVTYLCSPHESLGMKGAVVVE